MRTWPESIKVIERFNDSSRFTYEMIAVDGEVLFKKTAKNQQTGKNFDSELAWNDFMATVSSRYPELAIRNPDPFAYHPRTSLISEYIDAPLLATRSSVNKIRGNVERIAKVLQAVDSLGVGYKTDLPPREGKIDYTKLDSQWEYWFEASGGFGKYATDIEKARHTVLSSQKLQSCMQHGDFTPWHIFAAEDEWILFDSEHAHHLWPRFYDLAYCYSRLLSRQGSSDVAQELLSQYILTMKMSEDEFWPQFMPVLTSRAVGILSDSLSDFPELDYRRKAEDLLRVCLNGETSKLAKSI